MKAKPIDTRNLNLHGRVYYYDRVVNGRRICFSTRSADLAEAAAVRDLYERRRGIAMGAQLLVEEQAPTFRDFAEKYLEDGAAQGLAPSTVADRKCILGPSGSLVQAFGDRRLDEIGTRDLLRWWEDYMQPAHRAKSTVNNHLNALAKILRYAMALQLIERSPVADFREYLKSIRSTQRGRAEAEASAHRNPIEDAQELERFVAASAARSGASHVATLLMLDAGLRIGEAEALCWGSIDFGASAADPARALVIRESVSRSRYAGPTKSGRTRRVWLSQRLRLALLELRIAQGRPGNGARVLAGFDRKLYRRDHFDPIAAEVCSAAHTPKDLRDTFASWLLKLLPDHLKQISLQLGHREQSTTEMHYAKPIEEGRYREPLRLLEGEVPADLLARLPGAESQRIHNGAQSA